MAKVDTKVIVAATTTAQLAVGEVYERAGDDYGTILDKVIAILSDTTFQGRKGVVDITLKSVWIRQN